MDSEQRLSIFFCLIPLFHHVTGCRAFIFKTVTHKDESVSAGVVGEVQRDHLTGEDVCVCVWGGRDGGIVAGGLERESFSAAVCCLW